MDFDQGSELGKILDPVADRVLFITAGIALLIDGSVPVVVGVIVLAREAAISIAVAVLAARAHGASTCIDRGKAGTLALMFVFPMFLIADATSGAVMMSPSWGVDLHGERYALAISRRRLHPLARQALREGESGREPDVRSCGGEHEAIEDGDPGGR